MLPRNLHGSLCFNDAHLDSNWSVALGSETTVRSIYTSADIATVMDAKTSIDY